MVKCRSCGLEVPGSTLTGSNRISKGIPSVDKTPQRPRPVPVKYRKDMNSSVSCRHNMPEIILTFFPNKPWFLRVFSTSLLKTLWEKKKLLVTSNFFISRSVFYPFGEFSAIFIKSEIVVCKLFQFGKVYNLSFGKELKAA